MPKLPTSRNRTPTGATTPESRKAGLAVPDDDPDATQDLAAIDPSRAPLAMRDGEHGHIDGPRGLQDFHKHDGGDRPHPHRGTSSLGRTAALEEYVPPLAATVPPGVDQAADPTPAGVPDGAMGASSEPSAEGAATLVLAGSDAAGSGRSTELERTGGSGRGRLAAVERKVRARLAEVQVLTDVQDLVDAAVGQLDIGDLVGPAVIRQVKDTVDRWAAGRGVGS
jgi:hypothetical protein